MDNFRFNHIGQSSSPKASFSFPNKRSSSVGATSPMPTLLKRMSQNHDDGAAAAIPKPALSLRDRVDSRPTAGVDPKPAPPVNPPLAQRISAPDAPPALADRISDPETPTSHVHHPPKRKFSGDEAAPPKKKALRESSPSLLLNRLAPAVAAPVAAGATPRSQINVSVPPGPRALPYAGVDRKVTALTPSPTTKPARRDVPLAPLQATSPVAPAAPVPHMKSSSPVSAAAPSKPQLAPPPLHLNTDRQPPLQPSSPPTPPSTTHAQPPHPISPMLITPFPSSSALPTASQKPYAGSYASPTKPDVLAAGTLELYLKPLWAESEAQTREWLEVANENKRVRERSRSVQPEEERGRKRGRKVEVEVGEEEENQSEPLQKRVKVLMDEVRCAVKDEGSSLASTKMPGSKVESTLADAEHPGEDRAAPTDPRHPPNPVPPSDASARIDEAPSTEQEPTPNHRESPNASRDDDVQIDLHTEGAQSPEHEELSDGSQETESYTEEELEAAALLIAVAQERQRKALDEEAALKKKHLEQELAILRREEEKHSRLEKEEEERARKEREAEAERARKEREAQEQERISKERERKLREEVQRRKMQKAAHVDSAATARNVPPPPSVSPALPPARTVPGQNAVPAPASAAAPPSTSSPRALQHPLPPKPTPLGDGVALGPSRMLGQPAVLVQPPAPQRPRENKVAPGPPPSQAASTVPAVATPPARAFCTNASSPPIPIHAVINVPAPAAVVSKSPSTNPIVTAKPAVAVKQESAHTLPAPVKTRRSASQGASATVPRAGPVPTAASAQAMPSNDQGGTVVLRTDAPSTAKTIVPKLESEPNTALSQSAPCTTPATQAPLTSNNPLMKSEPDADCSPQPLLSRVPTPLRSIDSTSLSAAKRPRSPSLASIANLVVKKRRGTSVETELELTYPDGNSETSGWGHVDWDSEDEDRRPGGRHRRPRTLTPEDPPAVEGIGEGLSADFAGTPPRLLRSRSQSRSRSPPVRAMRGRGRPPMRGYRGRDFGPRRGVGRGEPGFSLPRSRSRSPPRWTATRPRTFDHWSPSPHFQGRLFPPYIPPPRVGNQWQTNTYHVTPSSRHDLRPGPHVPEQRQPILRPRTPPREPRYHPERPNPSGPSLHRTQSTNPPKIIDAPARNAEAAMSTMNQRSFLPRPNEFDTIALAPGPSSHPPPGPPYMRDRGATRGRFAVLHNDRPRSPRPRSPPPRSPPRYHPYPATHRTVSASTQFPPPHTVGIQATPRSRPPTDHMDAPLPNSLVDRILPEQHSVSNPGEALYIYGRQDSESTVRRGDAYSQHRRGRGSSGRGGVAVRTKLAARLSDASSLIRRVDDESNSG